jgi:hypothetical protein
VTYAPRLVTDDRYHSMAYHEMRLLFSKVLFNFDLTLNAECKANWRDQDVYILWKKKPLMCSLKPVA